MSGFPSLKDFVEAMGVAWPIAFAIWLGSCGILLASYIGVPYAIGLPSWVLTLAFIVGMFSAAICATTALRELIALCGKLLRWRADKTDRLQRLARLVDLPVHEHQIMAFLCITNTQVFPMPYADRRLVGLIEKGLINRQVGEHSLLDWPHAVPNFIWEEMRRHPEKFSIDRRMHGNPLARGRL